LGVKPQLIEGSRGVFDVVADGKLIFSKHEVDRFPEHEEILRSLRK
jgi:selT/selW/selH-like putative selenoprotein